MQRKNYSPQPIHAKIISMKIHQFSCREQDNIDLRQANAVIKHRPNIIILEAPMPEADSSLFFDSNESIAKQKKILQNKISNLKKVSKEFPWVASDITLFENVFELSKSGHPIKIYSVDAPSQLLKETIINKWNLMNKPRKRGSMFLWWVYIYLREKIMADNLRVIFKDVKKDTSILIFLQKFHWLNVKFQLSNPTKESLWNYYFGKFKKIKRSDVVNILKINNPVLYEYWMKHSDFK
jgi:hypothetical protein